jgi:hypothetical protein
LYRNVCGTGVGDYWELHDAYAETVDWDELPILLRICPELANYDFQSGASQRQLLYVEGGSG